MTDDLGRVTRIHYERVVNPLCWYGDNNSMTLKWFEDPTGLRTTVNYHRVGVPNASPWGFYGNMVVSTIVRNGKTWSYSDENPYVWPLQETDHGSDRRGSGSGLDAFKLLRSAFSTRWLLVGSQRLFWKHHCG